MSASIFRWGSIKTIFKIIFLLKLLKQGSNCEFSNCNNEPLMCLTDFGPTFCTEPRIGNNKFILAEVYYKKSEFSIIISQLLSKDV
jgi:hypothetical protein